MPGYGNGTSSSNRSKQGLRHSGVCLFGVECRNGTLGRGWGQVGR